MAVLLTRKEAFSRREGDTRCSEAKQRGVRSQGVWQLGSDLFSFQGSSDNLVFVIQWSTHGFRSKWKAAVSNRSFFFLLFACLLKVGLCSTGQPGVRCVVTLDWSYFYCDQLSVDKSDFSRG